MRLSRHEEAQVDTGINAGCLDVLTVFTKEMARVGGDTQACPHDTTLSAFGSVVAPSIGEGSRQSRRVREAGDLAAMMASRPWADNTGDDIVTAVKTARFDGDAA